jgi:alpha-maltose-1-phosphate synthase
MRVVVSVIGKFHCFDLARELHSHQALQAIFTGYPWFKLASEGLPRAKVHTFPYLQTPYMFMVGRGWLSGKPARTVEYLARRSMDAHVAARLPDCDVFVALSGAGLRSGRAARERGARFVCDRGSCHIRTQDQLLREEHERWGLAFDGIDPRVIETEEAEYQEADCITVPSAFAMSTFVARGVPAARLRRLPYGVDLARFHPTARPDADRFDVLFVGGLTLQKGVPYLLQAFAKLEHPNKSLTLAGSADPELIARLKDLGLWGHQIRCLGHVAQPNLKDLMSRSHVLVLPSVQDGFGMVMAQAMACGCPVIASQNTGAVDLLGDGEEGFVVPVRDAQTLAARLQRLADDPQLQQQMANKSLLRVRQIGGWQDYGQAAMDIYAGLVL